MRPLKIFEGVSADFLVKISKNIKLKTYKYGETILREGQKPDGLYIQYSGQCNMMLSGFGQRPLHRHSKKVDVYQK